MAEGTESPCLPDCEGKECGDDGCGGTCGTCPCFDCEPDEVVCGADARCSHEPPGHLGTEFWAVDLDNAFVPGGRSGYYDAAGQQYAAVVTNPSNEEIATVQVFDIGGLVDSATVGPGALTVFNLPRKDADGTVLDALAYRLVSDIPVAAYQFNPLDNVEVFSNDATVLYPTGSLGQEYYVVAGEQSFDELRSFATIVAVEEGETEVVVDVPARTLGGLNVHTGVPIPGLNSGETLKATLHQFDVLNIETDMVGDDMTGTHILATGKVAVFGGSEASNAPNTGHCLVGQGVCEWDKSTPCTGHLDCATFNTCCSDHLEHQMPPVSALGLVYHVAKTWPRGEEGDVYRVLALQAGTSVATEPEQTPVKVLGAGQWFEFESKQTFKLVADKPVLVAQIMASEQAPSPNPDGMPQPGDAGTGDPALIMLMPASQNRKDYTFPTPNHYEDDYMTIIAPAEAGGPPPAVWFDCASDPGGESPCPPLDSGLFDLSSTGETYVTRVPIKDGVHRLVAELPVAVYVYGFDQYVSYGYSAGSYLKPLAPDPWPQ